MKLYKRMCAAALAAAMLAGCAASASQSVQTASSETDTPAAQTDKYAPYMGTGEVGNKWLTVDIYGAIDADYPAVIQDDFMAAVSKDYISSLTIADGEKSAGSLNDCDKIMRQRCIDMLNDTSLTSPEAKAAQTYYEQSLDWDARNAAGLSVVEAAINKIEAFETLDDITAYITTDENTDYFMQIGVYGTPLNPGYYGLDVAATYLTLGYAEEYTSPTKTGEASAAYTKGASDYMLGRMGYTQAEADKLYNDFYDIEALIAQNILTKEERNSPDFYDKILNSYTMQQIKAEQGNYPLAEILDLFGFSKAETIVLEQPDWLKAMGTQVFTEENVEKLKSYLIVQRVVDDIYYTDKAAYDERTALVAKRDGITGTLTDEQVGYEYTDGKMSELLDNMYVQNYCSPEQKQKVIDLILQYKDAYRTMLEGEDWLSDETKAIAIDKLESMTYRVCYPDNLKDYSDLTLKTNAEGGSFYDSKCIVSRYQIGLQAQRLNTAITQDDWNGSIRSVNAYYSHTDNSINIYSGILLGAMDIDADYETVLGSIGYVIGHEISHAFDTTGAQYDKTGAYNNWWTDEDYEKFTQRADKLAAYFDKIVPYEGSPSVDGDTVKSEAIADMGGTRAGLAIAADIPDFDYNKFFEATAMMWAGVATKESVDKDMLGGKHPIDSLRVNTTVSQFEEFYDTYDVKEGDGMYLAPEERVAVW